MSDPVTWRMQIDGFVRFVRDVDADSILIEGTGPVPRVEPVGPPVVVPPPPPPPPPPTDEPFAWPPEPSGLSYDPAERNVGLGGGFYASASEFANPLPASNRFAGLMPPALLVPIRGQMVYVGGYRLWAPRDAPDALVRRVLLTGLP